MVQNTHASFKLTLVMILATVFIFGCSFGGNKSNPVVPGGDTTSQEVTGSEIREGSEGGNHILLGFNMIHIDATDPTDVQVEVVPVRSGELHLNILSLLEVGMCADCFSIVGITSPEPGVLDVDIEITHPLDDPTYTLFDVRGIMMFNGGHLFPASGLTMSDSSMGDGELLNADGHTQLYNGSTLGQAGPLVTYYKGKFATPAVPNADLNGFLRHTTDDPGNTRNALYASDSVTRTYSLVMPSTTWVFGYAVDASWDLPTMPVTDPMTDFPDTANCIEPWKVAASSEPILDDGETELLIEVHDRQGTGSHADPVIECPELFDGQVTASLYGTGNGFALYNAIISNNKLADGGDYRCLISVEDNANSSSPDYIDLTGRGIYEVHVISTNGPGYLIWAKRAGGTE